MAKNVEQSSGLAPVKVTPREENWSEYNLSDGTLLRVRPLVIEVERHLDQVSPQGDPIYQIKAGVIFDVKSSKPKAKRQAKKPVTGKRK